MSILNQWKSRVVEPQPEPLDAGAVQATHVFEDAIGLLVEECLNYCSNVPGAKAGNLLDSIAAGVRGRVEAHLMTTPRGKLLSDMWHGVAPPPPPPRRAWHIWDASADMSEDD